MAHIHRILAFLLVPLAAFLGASGWYGWRGVQIWRLYDLSSAWGWDLQRTMAMGHVTILIGGLLGMIVAAGTGPQAAAAVAFVAMAGLTVLQVLGPTELFFPTWLGLGLFWGMSRPGVWAAAAVPFHRPYEGLRIGLFAVAYAAINAGAALSGAALTTFGGGLDLDLTGGALVFGAFGGSAVAMGALSLIWFIIPSTTEELAAPTPYMKIEGSALLKAGAALALFGILEATWVAGSSFATDLAYQSPTLPPWIHMLNPAAVIPATVLLGVVASAMVLVNRPIPWYAVTGLGLALSGLITALVLLPATPAGDVPLMAYIGLGGLAEALLMPIIYARVGGDLHWRLSAVPYGLAFALTSLVSLGLLVPAALNLTVPFAVALGVIQFILGVATMIAAFPLETFVFHTPTDAELERLAEQEAEEEAAGSQSATASWA